MQKQVNKNSSRRSVGQVLTLGSKLNLPSASSWKSLPDPCQSVSHDLYLSGLKIRTCPRSSWLATWNTASAIEQSMRRQECDTNLQLERAVVPGLVELDIVRVDEGDLLIRCLGSEDVLQEAPSLASDKITRICRVNLQPETRS